MCGIALTDWLSEYDAVQRAAYQRRQRARARGLRVFGGPRLGIGSLFGSAGGGARHAQAPALGGGDDADDGSVLQLIGAVCTDMSLIVDVSTLQQRDDWPTLTIRGGRPQAAQDGVDFKVSKMINDKLRHRLIRS